MSLNQVDEKMVQEAEEYIKKHRLTELFEVVIIKPESCYRCCLY